MIRKLCLQCRVVCWHNPMKGEGAYRCTFCGSPVPPKSSDEGKKFYLNRLRDNKINRARLLQIQEA